MYNDLIGKPFQDGGRGPGDFDCWGLVLEVFRRNRIALPDYKVACMDFRRVDNTIADNRKDWIRCDPAEVPIPSLVVIKFNHPLLCNHTGVYIGDGRFIHARNPIGVNIDRIDSPAWRRKIEGFYVPKGGGQ